ncbi:MAG: type II toxin-antitoxin system MqsA family antitoxin [Sulfurimonas sp.]
MKSEQSNRCPVCKGYKSMSDTTFTVDLGFGVVVVRHVPAEVCEQCGAEWIDDATSKNLEDIVTYARSKHSIVEISEYSTLSKSKMAS